MCGRGRRSPPALAAEKPSGDMWSRSIDRPITVAQLGLPADAPARTLARAAIRRSARQLAVGGRLGAVGFAGEPLPPRPGSGSRLHGLRYRQQVGGLRVLWSQLAVTGERGRLTLWDAQTLAPAGELKGLAGFSQALAFSPDGKLLAAAEVDASQPRPLRVWDVRRRALTDFRGKTAAGSIAFSPDGRLIAAAAIERGTDIRDARTGRLVKRIGIGDFSGQGDFSRSVTFSPGGDLLFVGQYDGRGHLYSTETWRRVGQPLEAHTARITFPEFSPDGRTLVTAAADGTVVLWDVSTQKPIGAPLALDPNTFASAALSPDGSRLFAVSTSGPGISFDLSPEAWKRHACLVAGRELTAREWEEALPGRPYRAVCSGG